MFSSQHWSQRRKLPRRLRFDAETALASVSRRRIERIGPNGFARTSTFRLARKALVAVFGSSVLGVGVALIVLPGPAILVIPLGLAILATEFLWARQLLQWLKVRARLKVQP